jgi:hypothetical protein
MGGDCFGEICSFGVATSRQSLGIGGALEYFVSIACNLDNKYIHFPIPFSCYANEFKRIIACEI